MTDTQLSDRVQQLEERVRVLEGIYSRGFAEINTEFTLLWNSLSDDERRAKLDRGMDALSDEMCRVIGIISMSFNGRTSEALRTELKNPTNAKTCMGHICERYRSHTEHISVLLGAAQTLLTILKHTWMH
jgi:hypothetical protein